MRRITPCVLHRAFDARESQRATTRACRLLGRALRPEFIQRAPIFGSPDALLSLLRHDCRRCILLDVRIDLSSRSPLLSQSRGAIRYSDSVDSRRRDHRSRRPLGAVAKCRGGLGDINGRRRCWSCLHPLCARSDCKRPSNDAQCSATARPMRCVVPSSHAKIALQGPGRTEGVSGPE